MTSIRKIERLCWSLALLSSIAAKHCGQIAMDPRSPIHSTVTSVAG